MLEEREQGLERPDLFYMEQPPPPPPVRADVSIACVSLARVRWYDKKNCLLVVRRRCLPQDAGTRCRGDKNMFKPGPRHLVCNRLYQQ